MVIVRQGVYVFGVRDSFGSVWVGVAANPNDAGSVKDINSRDGQPLEFHGEMYRIPDWCIQNGLQCVATKRTIEIDFPE